MISTEKKKELITDLRFLNNTLNFNQYNYNIEDYYLSKIILDECIECCQHWQPHMPIVPEGTCINRIILGNIFLLFNYVFMGEDKITTFCDSNTFCPWMGTWKMTKCYCTESTIREAQLAIYDLKILSNHIDSILSLMSLLER